MIQEVRVLWQHKETSKIGHRMSPTDTGQDQKNELKLSGNKEEGRLAQKKGTEFYQPRVEEPATEALLSHVSHLHTHILFVVHWHIMAQPLLKK